MKINKINILYLSSFLMSFSYGVLLTLPLFLNKYLSLPISFSGEVISMGILGVFPTILLLPRVYNFMSNSILISLGALIYAVGIFFIIAGNVYLYYVAGVLFGIGWGIVYTLGPIIISQLSTDENRANNFSYISAFNMLGAGLAPVLVRYLDVHKISIYHTYGITFLLALLACVLFYFVKIKR